MSFKISIIILILILLASCNIFNDHTNHYMRIDNESSDTLWIIISGDSTGSLNEVLPPMSINYRDGYMRIYDMTYRDSLTEVISQEQFNLMVDSFIVHIKVDGEWQIRDIPEFWSLGYWALYEHSDDEYLNYSYYFNITDSLLNR